jgi:hypothetical protein
MIQGTDAPLGIADEITVIDTAGFWGVPNFAFRSSTIRVGTGIRDNITYGARNLMTP